MIPNHTWVNYEKKGRLGIKRSHRSYVAKWHDKSDLIRLGIKKGCNSSCNNYSPLTHCGKQ